MFSKNDGEKKGDSSNVYDLNEMPGKLVALYYYSELKNEGNNITLPTDNSSNNSAYPSSMNLTITNKIIFTSGNQVELRSEISDNTNNNYFNSFNNYTNNNPQQNNNIQNNVDNIINNTNDNQKKEDESNQDNILMKSIISHRVDNDEN